MKTLLLLALIVALSGLYLEKENLIAYDRSVERDCSQRNQGE